MARLTIDITDHQHQALKAMAAIEGTTIKAYALERLFQASGNEEQALGALKALLEQRMAEALRGDVSSKSITQVADETMRTDGAT